MSIPLFVQDYQIIIEQELNAYLNADSFKTVPNYLYEAIRYVVMSPAKRIRPILMCLVGEMLEIPMDELTPFVCAIEFLHTYSLVHDDLPAMDNDNFRRGLPSCHAKYGEATAILVGDSLQNEVFVCIANARKQEPRKIFNILRLFTHCSGVHGMIAGQFLDITNKIEVHEEKLVSRQEINALKTGKLFYLSVMVAAQCVSKPLPKQHYKVLEDYAQALGGMFQARDDMLDYQEDKDTAMEQKHILQQAEQDLYNYYDKCNTSLFLFGKRAGKLLELNEFLVNRIK